MKHILNMFIALIMCSAIYGQSVSAENIFNKASESVVVVITKDSFGKEIIQGSGVVINENGLIVTNYHVAAGNKSLEVRRGNIKIQPVEIIAQDADKDLLLLKIDKNIFPAIRKGNSKILVTGQKVYTIGSPLGLENSMSEGIISGFRNSNIGGSKFIQITASISPGSSGGALLSDKGELIGINTFTAKEGQNLNFAIPLEDVLKLENENSKKEKMDQSESYLEKAQEARLNGQWDIVLKYSSLYLKKYPNNVKVLKDRGFAKLILKDYSGASEDYDRAIEIDPLDDYSYYYKAILKQEQEDYYGALIDINKAIELWSKNNSYYEKRGNIKEYLKDYQGAITDYTLAIEKTIEEWAKYSAYDSRGDVKLLLQDYNGAIQDYDKAVEASYKIGEKNLLSSFMNRAFAKLKLEDFTSAIKDYNKVIEHMPNSDDAYLNRGFCKSKLGDIRGSIQDYTKAILVNPKNNMAYFNRAIQKYNLNDVEGALLDWSKAGELGNTKAYEIIRNIGR